MEKIKIFMKDGSVKEFRHRPRPGGSYSLQIKYENGWAIVIDEYHNQTAIQSVDIKEIQTSERMSL